MKFKLGLGAAAILAALPAQADQYTEAIKGFYEAEIMGWASDPVLIQAILNQNAQTHELSADQIIEMDQAWRAEVGTGTTPTITPVLKHPASDFLRARVADYGGQITEIFVMDAQGLNVAASDVTSDYWQGDEAKHSETYGMGVGGFHVSEIELDESTQRYQAQVSFTLTDPASGQAVGAMTVGVDAESLM